MRVLVTWGSTRGGTETIARIVGDELTKAGFDVALRSARQISSSAGFDAVIVGGALYANRWHHEARRFVRRNQRRLQSVPIWMFSSGPLDGSADQGQVGPTKEVRALMHCVGAQGHVTFGGRLAPDARGFPAATMAKTRAGDFRNTAQIRAWALDIARGLPDAKPNGAIPMPGSSLVSVAGHAFVGWAACGLAMEGMLAVASTSVALAVHAVATAGIFAALAMRYFRLAGARDPLPTALVVVTFVGLLDLVFVAGLAGVGLAMFESVAGVWAPLALAFCSMWIVGTLVAMTAARSNASDAPAGSILILVGHPSHDSFTASLAEAYCAGAGQAAEILYVGDLAFDPSLREGYRKVTPLEPDLVRAQELIGRARHLVLFYPQWWGAAPAVLKGFIDRVLLPGFAFQHHARDPFSEGLLAGRSGEIWLTSDAPRIWYLLKYWDSPIRAMKTATLEFCGVRPVNVTAVDRVRYLDEQARRVWLYRARAAGADAARDVARRAMGQPLKAPQGPIVADRVNTSSKAALAGDRTLA